MARVASGGCVASVVLGLVLGLLAGCHEDPSPYLLAMDLGPSIRDLGSDDLEVSSGASSRLESIGVPVLPALATAMHREPKRVRVGVVEVLTEIGGEGATQLLAGAVTDPDAEVRADAAFALRDRPGAVAEQALIRALGDADATVRRNAAVACGAACRSADAVRALVGCALDDSAPPVGWAAVVALGRLRTAGDPSLAADVDAACAAAGPERMVGDDLEPRTRAAVLLAVLGDERAAPVLGAALPELHDPRQRLRAIYGLGFVAGPTTVPVLRAVLAEPGMAVYAHDALRRAAARNVPGASDALASYTGAQSPIPLPPPP